MFLPPLGEEILSGVGEEANVQNMDVLDREQSDQFLIKGTERDTVTIVTTAYMNLYPPCCNPLGYNKDFKPLLLVCTACPLAEE